MVRKNLLLVILILFSITSFSSAERFGYNLLQEDTFNNNTAFVNESANWVTPSLGTLSDANSTQLQSNAGTLSIKESWLTTFGNNLWCSLTGCTMAGDIDMGGNDIIIDDWAIKEFEGHANLGGVNVLGLFATRAGGVNLPHVAFSPGGAGQATALVRSQIIVNETETCLSGTNATNTQCYADQGGFTWNIDFNSSTTGADLGVTDDLEVIGDAWFYDEEGEAHNKNRELSHKDALENDIILDQVNVSAINNGTNTIVIITSVKAGNIEVNLAEEIFSFDSPSINITLTNGNNETPVENHVIITAGPTLESRSVHPSHNPEESHIDVGTYIVGDLGYVISSGKNTYQLYEGLHGPQHRLKHQGPAYVEGFDANVSATEFNLTSGETIIIYDFIECENLTMADDGFYYINSTGNFIHGTDLSVIDEYSDGTSFTNKYMPLVVGVVPKNGICKLVFVPSGYPGLGQEYVNCLSAEEDSNMVRNVFPSNPSVKQAFTPTTWVLLDGQSDQFCAFKSGDFSRKIAGDVTGGGGAPTSPPSDHAALSNLEWSNAGHTIDTNVDLDGNNLLNVSYIETNEMCVGVLCDSPTPEILYLKDGSPKIFFNDLSSDNNASLGYNFGQWGLFDDTAGQFVYTWTFDGIKIFEINPGNQDYTTIINDDEGEQFRVDGDLNKTIIKKLNVTTNLTVGSNVNITNNLTIGTCTTWFNGTVVIEDC